MLEGQMAPLRQAAVAQKKRGDDPLCRARGGECAGLFDEARGLGAGEIIFAVSK